MDSLFSLPRLGVLAAALSLMSSKFPRSETIVHFPSDPVTLPVRKGDAGDGVQSTSLRALVEMNVSSLLADFKPLWWLFNGHLQTIYCVLGNFSAQEEVLYRRTYLQLADGGTIGLDWAIQDEANSDLKDDTPVVVVQHGLTGGSFEPYVRAVLSRSLLPKAKGGLGYRAVVINFRGCAGVPITSPRFYSAGHTDDTRNALLHIANRYPKAPLLALGFSLGANVITRYLGEEKLNARFHAACALACPWDLDDNNSRLLGSFLGKHIYSKGMGGNLLRLLQRHRKAFLNDSDKDHFVAQAAANAVTLKNPTLDQFDQAFTRIAGGPPPHFPFPSVRDYYQTMSSHEILEHVQIPYLAINAADDPIVQRVPLHARDNPFVVMGLTAGGGHLGWFQAGKNGNVDRWTTQPVLDWLKLMGDDVVHDPTPRGNKIFIDNEGWLREEGREDLGCREVSEEDNIYGNKGDADVWQGL